MMSHKFVHEQTNEHFPILIPPPLHLAKTTLQDLPLSAVCRISPRPLYCNIPHRPLIDTLPFCSGLYGAFSSPI
ncbi:hypothetical protein HZ326_22517 [Fusarium oxysporum f. sp. albedinis]|nr:hypothetical protein HZ326_22517 [Fusarium oxysporum f. sp. albedinis]